MFDDILGIAQSAIERGGSDPPVPYLVGGKPIERMISLRALLDHLDQELPQLIVEALFESMSAVTSDVGVLLRVDDKDVSVAYSTDPSLLDKRIAWGVEGPQATRRLPPAVLEALALSEAFARKFRCGDRDWILVLGERTGKINRESFLACEETIVGLFESLLERSTGSNARTYVDHVTGLADRWATMGRIGETIMAAKRNGERAAVLFVDLNGFKQVNDSYGHQHGDGVLKSVAVTMRDALRSNEFVGRIGGDEFAVVLPSIKALDDAERVAMRLYEGVEGLQVTHETGVVSLGIGIAIYPDHATNQEEWLHHADIAMYRAKRLKQPFCTYDAAWYGETGSVAAMSESDQAYEQQFLLCFQPIFDVQSGEVRAVEALVRWLHPQDGILSASNTMKAALRWHATKDLDLWVTRRALAYIKRWRKFGIERVHVNIATTSESTYLGLIQAVTESGADPAMLAVELDYPAPEAVEEYTRFVEALSRVGISVGIDGCGGENLNLSFL